MFSDTFIDREYISRGTGCTDPQSTCVNYSVVLSLLTFVVQLFGTTFNFWEAFGLVLWKEIACSIDTTCFLSIWSLVAQFTFGISVCILLARRVSHAIWNVEYTEIISTQLESFLALLSVFTNKIWDTGIFFFSEHCRVSSTAKFAAIVFHRGVQSTIWDIFNTGFFILWKFVF